MILRPLRKLFFVLVCLVSIPALAWDEPLVVQGQGSQDFLANGGTDRLEKVRGLGLLTKKYDQIYIFGDSLSDIDSVASKSGGALPPRPFYWSGRFSNGPSWIDYFSESVQVPFKSFAHAGARLVGQNNFYVIPSFLKGLWVDSIASQIDDFKKVRTRLDSKDLIMIWAGSNDYLLFPGHKSIQVNVTAVKDLIESLQQMGAENIVVINVPDVSRSPFHGLGIGRLIMDPYFINLWVQAHNAELKKIIGELLKKNPGRQLALVDMYSAFTEILDHPGQFGFSNIDYPCIGGQLMPGGLSFAPFDFTGLPRVICQNADESFFWDPWHPSTHAHCLASISVLSSLANQGWVAEYNKDLGLESCQ